MFAPKSTAKNELCRARLADGYVVAQHEERATRDQNFANRYTYGTEFAVFAVAQSR
jgi:hypothetical protein